jgi:hypothetical protein
MRQTHTQPAVTIDDCPFCGWHDVEIGDISPLRIAVDCPECWCIGPGADTVPGAIALWNWAGVSRKMAARRKAPQAAGQHNGATRDA